MNITFTYTSFISSLIFTSVLFLWLSVYIRFQEKIFTLKEVNYLLICFGFLALRLYGPFEIPLGHSIYISHFYASVCRFLRQNIWSSLTVMNIFYIFSLTGSAVLILIKIKEHKKLQSILKNAKYHKEIEIKKKSGKTVKIPILQLENITEPFLIGIIHPRIIFPKHLIGEEKYILQHELEHYKHHDLYYKWIFEILTVIYWWNPFVHLLKNQLDNLLELHNDFSVTNRISSTEKIKYAETLILTAKEKEEKKPIAGLGLVHKRNLLEARIYSIFAEKIKNKNLFFLGSFLLITIASFFLIIEPVTYPKFPDNMFTLEEAYAVKTEDGYQIYVNGKLITQLKELPKDFANISIRKKK